MHENPLRVIIAVAFLVSVAAALTQNVTQESDVRAGKGKSEWQVGC